MMKKYNFVGSSVDYYIPDDIEVYVKIVDHPRTTSRTPDTDQYLTTWHDTGNPDTNAWDEYKWLAGGRKGGEKGGYNFIFDDKVIIQTGRLNEQTWHAGTPDGNWYSWGAEQAWGGSVNFDRSLYVGASLHGALCAAQGWEVDTHLVKHQYWYGKWCPGQILNRGIWSDVVRMTSDAAALAKAAANGETDTPVTVVYAKPDPIAALTAVKQKIAPATVYDESSKVTFIRVDDRVRVVEDTPRLQYAYADSPWVGPILKTGEEFDVDWIFVAGDGRWYYYTPWATRVDAASCERISDVKIA